MRHANQFYSGEVWSITKGTIPAFLKFVLQVRALGQGILPVMADKHRGIYQATFQYLQDRQMISEEWHQGQVLLYLPEFQELLLQEARKQGCQLLVQSISHDYQNQELQEIQRQARSISHTDPDHPYSDEDC